MERFVMIANTSKERSLWLGSDLSSLLLRAALAASFISAVADRFGLWGTYGHAHVSWGDFARFVDYTHTLTSVFPISLSVFFAWTATAAETILAVLLLVGWRVRAVSIMSGLLLLAFTVAITFSLGIKAALDYSVPSAAAASLLLSSRDPDRF